LAFAFDSLGSAKKQAAAHAEAAREFIGWARWWPLV